MGEADGAFSKFLQPLHILSSLSVPELSRQDLPSRTHLGGRGGGRHCPAAWSLSTSTEGRAHGPPPRTPEPAGPHPCFSFCFPPSLPVLVVISLLGFSEKVVPCAKKKKKEEEEGIPGRLLKAGYRGSPVKTLRGGVSHMAMVNTVNRCSCEFCLSCFILFFRTSFTFDPTRTPCGCTWDNPTMHWVFSVSSRRWQPPSRAILDPCRPAPSRLAARKLKTHS